MAIAAAWATLVHMVSQLCRDRSLFSDSLASLPSVCGTMQLDVATCRMMGTLVLHSGYGLAERAVHMAAQGEDGYREMARRNVETHSEMKRIVREEIEVRCGSRTRILSFYSLSLSRARSFLPILVCLVSQR